MVYVKFVFFSLSLWCKKILSKFSVFYQKSEYALLQSNLFNNNGLLLTEEIPFYCSFLVLAKIFPSNFLIVLYVGLLTRNAYLVRLLSLIENLFALSDDNCCLPIFFRSMSH